MAFSIFGKKKDDDDAATSKPVGIKRPAGMPTQAPISLRGVTTGSVTMSELSMGQLSLDALQPEDLSVMDEVAILYANEQVAAATELVQTAVAHKTHAEELWMMLFELYQQQLDKKAFDELTLEYVLLFERSAPLWKAPLAAKPAAVGAKSVPAYGSMSAQVLGETPELVAILNQLAQGAVGGQEYRLDWSKVKAADTLGAQHVFQLMSTLRRQKKVRFSHQNTKETEILLRNKIEVMRNASEEAPFWILLLELLQGLDRQDDFENLAVDYAVTFEVSPPSWDALPVVDIESGEKGAMTGAATPVRSGAVGQEYVLVGSIHAADDVLKQLQVWGDQQAAVVINCEPLVRFDFAAAGVLNNMLIQWQSQGKLPQLVHVSHLVAGLFRVMGVIDSAEIRLRNV